MKILEIQNHLRETLPTFNDSFTNPIAVNSLSVTSNVITVSGTAHGLVVGNPISMYGIEYVHAVTLDSKPSFISAQLSTAKNIDYGQNDSGQIILESNEAFYNGTFPLAEGWQNGDLTFVIDKVSNQAPDSTAEVINVVEVDRCELNSVFTVASVIDANTFTVNTDLADSIASEFRGGEFYSIDTQVKIISSVDLNHITADVLQAMDLQDKKLAVLVAGDSLVSRSRNISTDASQRLEYGTDIQIDSWEEFTIFVFAKCSDTIDPTEIQDECRNEIKVGLLKSLQGFEPEKVFDADYDFIFFNGDGFLTYDKGYYIHQYNFGVTIKFNINDSYQPKSCQLKAIQTDYYKDEDLKATDKINFPIN